MRFFLTYLPYRCCLYIQLPPSHSSAPLSPHSLLVSVHSLCSASFIYISLSFALILFLALQRKVLKQLIRTLKHILRSFFESVSYENRIFPDIKHSRSPRSTEMPPNQTVSGQIRHSSKTSNLAFFKNSCQVHKERETAFNCLVYIRTHHIVYNKRNLNTYQSLVELRTEIVNYVCYNTLKISRPKHKIKHIRGGSTQFLSVYIMYQADLKAHYIQQ